jgi:molecular chaperone GrpE
MTKEHHKTPEDHPAEAPETKGAPVEAVTLTKTEYEALKTDAAKAQESWDRLMRQQADFDNIRKRLEREKQEFLKFASEDVIADVLGVLDDLERSLEAAQNKQENFEAFLKGIEMILAHLYEMLKKRGVVVIKAQGAMFDPLCHEALLQTETSDHKDGEVLEELQKGYTMHDRVLRTSKVRVAKRIEKPKT